MAAGTVTFLLIKLTDYLEKEVKHLSEIRTEVQYIRDQLELMKAFLEVADHPAQQSNELLKVWVKQVSDVAYDTEDALDKFKLRFAHHHGDRFYAPFHKTIRSIKNLKAQHQIASELQGIRSRVVIISDTYQRFQSGVNIIEQGSTSTAPSNEWYDPRKDALLQEEALLVGLEKAINQLKELLGLEDFGLKVVSVVGMGGLGKTTLVKKVYNDAGIKQHFHSHVWITVSQSFKMKVILKDIIQQLFREIKHPVPQEANTMDRHGLKSIIKEFLQQRKYILVLDDVWNIDAWKEIKVALPTNNKCVSRVILTTRNTKLASDCCQESKGPIYKLKPLSEDESWHLFSKRTFQNGCPSHLEKIARNILRKCKGLPLAIVTISGVLATRNIKHVDEWDVVDGSLHATLGDDHDYKHTRHILTLSYNDLPYHLKSCFLYLSIFPEDHLIEGMRLIRLWIAEGFVEQRRGRTQEEVAEDYLRELLNRSLIQMAETTSDGRIKKFHIHDLLRDIIIEKSRDQKFAAVAEQTQWPDRVRRLSVHNNLPRVRPHNTISQLRSLLMFGMRDTLSKSSMPILFSGGHTLLTVLDLKAAPLDTFPDAVVKLYHLRYLSLRDTKVKMIPSSIGKLQNLETLDLKHAFVTRLPVEILTLQRLRHLLVYRNEEKPYVPFHAKQGFKAPFRIGKLQSLQKLCFVEADQSVNHKSIVSQLGELNQLRRLGITKLQEKDGEALLISIEKLRKLRALSITAITEKEIIDIQYEFSPPEFLQRLYLTGRLEFLPQWIPSLRNLVKLFLKWSRLGNDLLGSLQDLPNLVHLELLQAYVGHELHFKLKKFQRLEILNLDKLDALQSVIVDQGAMPNLKKLVIQRCTLLKELPSGIEFLTNIKILEFFDMPDELMLSMGRKGQDQWKVQSIPEVYFTYWRDDKWDPYSLESVDDEESSDQPSSSSARRHKSRQWLYLPKMKRQRSFNSK